MRILDQPKASGRLGPKPSPITRSWVWRQSSHPAKLVSPNRTIRTHNLRASQVSSQDYGTRYPTIAPHQVRPIHLLAHNTPYEAGCSKRHTRFTDRPTCIERVNTSKSSGWVTTHSMYPRSHDPSRGILCSRV